MMSSIVGSSSQQMMPTGATSKGLSLKADGDNTLHLKDCKISVKTTVNNYQCAEVPPLAKEKREPAPSHGSSTVQDNGVNAVVEEEVSQQPNEERSHQFHIAIWIDGSRIISVFGKSKDILKEVQRELEEKGNSVDIYPEKGEIAVTKGIELKTHFKCESPPGLKIENLGKGNPLLLNDRLLRRKKLVMYFKPSLKQKDEKRKQEYEAFYHAIARKKGITLDAVEAFVPFVWPSTVPDEVTATDDGTTTSATPTQIHIENIFAGGDAHIVTRNSQVDRRSHPSAASEPSERSDASSNQNQFSEIRSLITDALKKCFDKPATVTHDIGPNGGSVKLDGCEVDIPPRLGDENIAIEMVVADNSSLPTQNSSTAVSRALKCKPSDLGSRVKLKLESFLHPEEGKELTILIMTRAGDQDWKEVGRIPLLLNNEIEFEVPHFCWYVAMVTEEEEKNGEYHLFNDVWMDCKTGIIASLFCKDKISFKRASKAFDNKDYKSILPLSEELIVSIGDIVKVTFDGPPDIIIEGVDSTDAQIPITHENMKNNFFLLLFKQVEQFGATRAEDVTGVSYNVLVYAEDDNQTREELSVPLDISDFLQEEEDSRSLTPKPKKMYPRCDSNVIKSFLPSPCFKLKLCSGVDLSSILRSLFYGRNKIHLDLRQIQTVLSGSSIWLSRLIERGMLEYLALPEDLPARSVREILAAINVSPPTFLYTLIMRGATLDAESMELLQQIIRDRKVLSQIDLTNCNVEKWREMEEEKEFQNPVMKIGPPGQKEEDREEHEVDFPVSDIELPRIKDVVTMLEEKKLEVSRSKTPSTVKSASDGEADVMTRAVVMDEVDVQLWYENSTAMREMVLDVRLKQQPDNFEEFLHLLEHSVIHRISVHRCFAESFKIERILKSLNNNGSLKKSKKPHKVQLDLRENSLGQQSVDILGLLLEAGSISHLALTVPENQVIRLQEKLSSFIPSVPDKSHFTVDVPHFARDILQAVDNSSSQLEALVLDGVIMDPYTGGMLSRIIRDNKISSLLNLTETKKTVRGKTSGKRIQKGKPSMLTDFYEPTATSFQGSSVDSSHATSPSTSSSDRGERESLKPDMLMSMKRKPSIHTNLYESTLEPFLWLPLDVSLTSSPPKSSIDKDEIESLKPDMLMSMKGEPSTHTNLYESTLEQFLWLPLDVSLTSSPPKSSIDEDEMESLKPDMFRIQKGKPSIHTDLYEPTATSFQGSSVDGSHTTSPSISSSVRGERESLKPDMLKTRTTLFEEQTNPSKTVGNIETEGFSPSPCFKVKLRRNFRDDNLTAVLEGLLSRKDEIHLDLRKIQAVSLISSIFCLSRLIEHGMLVYLALPEDLSKRPVRKILAAINVAPASLNTLIMHGATLDADSMNLLRQIIRENKVLSRIDLTNCKGRNRKLLSRETFRKEFHNRVVKIGPRGHKEEDEEEHEMDFPVSIELPRVKDVVTMLEEIKLEVFWSNTLGRVTSTSEGEADVMTRAVVMDEVDIQLWYENSTAMQKVVLDVRLKQQPHNFKEFLHLLEHSVTHRIDIRGCFDESFKIERILKSLDNNGSLRKSKKPHKVQLDLRENPLDQRSIDILGDLLSTGSISHLALTVPENQVIKHGKKLSRSNSIVSDVRHFTRDILHAIDNSSSQLEALVLDGAVMDHSAGFMLSRIITGNKIASLLDLSQSKIHGKTSRKKIFKTFRKKQTTKQTKPSKIVGDIERERSTKQTKDLQRSSSTRVMDLTGHVRHPQYK